MADDAEDEGSSLERKRKKDLAFKALVSVIALTAAVLVIPQFLSTAESDLSDRERTEFNLTGQPMKGSQDAPVTIVEFGDYYCPACQAFEMTVMPRIEDNYIETGEANLYYFDFPLNRHNPQARTASVAAQCVFRQDSEAFWSYHEALYENQQSIEYDAGGLTSLARDSTGGLDYGSLRDCIEGEETDGAVDRDRETGLNANLPGTPTIYVNGIRAQSINYNAVETLIEAEIENESR